jgi:hypothetical protein
MCHFQPPVSSRPQSPADGARVAGGTDGTAQPPPVLQEGQLPSSDPSAQNQPLVYRKPGTGGERIMALDVLERHFSFRYAPLSHSITHSLLPHCLESNWGGGGEWTTSLAVRFLMAEGGG